MNTKLISKFRKWRVTGAIALVIILSMALSMLPVPAMADPGMNVNIIECPGNCEGDLVDSCLPCVIPVTTDFAIKAKITNTTNAVQHGVIATISISGNAILVNEAGEPVEDADDIELGTMDKNEVNEVAWNLHCNGEGDVHIEVHTNVDSNYDWCDFTQQMEPQLIVTQVVAPCQVCTDCNDQYVVTASIHNAGHIGATDVDATISASPPASVIITPPYTKDIDDGLLTEGQLPGGDTKSVSWIVTCNQTGTTTFTVVATGNHAITGAELDTASNTAVTLQQDILVNVLCVQALQSTSTADNLIPCGPACPSKYGGKADWVSTLQMFAVTANISNCNETDTVSTNVTIIPPAETQLAPGQMVHVVVWNAAGTIKIEDTFRLSSETVTVNICPCCYALVTWMLQCTGSTNDNPVPIVVEAQAAAGGPVYDNTDCSPAYIEQEDKVHIRAGINPAQQIAMQAIVDDCGGTTVVDGVAVCQNFDVKIVLENTGEADAENVYVDVNIAGQASCAGPHNNLSFGTINGGAKKTKYLSEFGINCHCDAEDGVEVTITDIRGDDENTCEPIWNIDGDPDFDNIEPICPLDIAQCEFDVHIVNPHYCENIDVCTIFAVKALLENCGECDLEDLDATLSWSPPGANVELMPDSPPTVNVANLPHFEEDPLNPLDDNDCTVEEVSWNLKCTGADPNVTFRVCVESNPTADPAKGPHLKVIDTHDPVIQPEGFPVTIHQIPRDPAEVYINIISPDNYEALYATSEEFAVTAVVKNDEPYATITIDTADLVFSPDTAASQRQEFPVPFDIPAQGLKTLTWTVHCNHSGLMDIQAHIEGMSEVCEPVDVTSCPIAVHQYPAAHLMVEIIDAPEQPVVTCSTYNVTAKIYNTGEADADEVYATVSVNPPGSVRVSEFDEEGTYTKYVGTIPGHRIGEPYYKTVTWNLHCKVPCDSEITVTATGDDEYGWHLKQHCASSGHFDIYKGVEHLAILWQDDCNPDGCDSGMVTGIFVGDSAGLVGPFIFDSNFGYKDFPPIAADLTGRVVITGYVQEKANLSGYPTWLPGLPDPGSILGDIPPGADMMVFTGNVYLSDCIPPVDGDFCVTPAGGRITVVNGLLTGQYDLALCNPGGPAFLKSLLAGTYCTRLAAEAGRTIDAKFIEPDGVTVKQLPADIDLVVDKTADPTSVIIGQPATFTVTVTNDGPGNASGVIVEDVLPFGATYMGHSADQGWYDVSSGLWVIGNLDVGDIATLTISVKFNVAGEICNRATVVAADQHELDIANDSDEECVIVDNLPVTDNVSECGCCDDPELGEGLGAGYNLMSLSCIPATDNIVEFWAGAPLRKLSYYDPTTVNESADFDGWWFYYGEAHEDWPFIPPAWQTLEVMEDGLGYWALMADDYCLEYDGYQIAPPAPKVPHAYSVYEGWNMIGFKSVVAKLAADYLVSIDGKYTMMYGYDNDTGYFIVGTYGRQYLEPCHGYWLAMTADGIVFP